VRTFHALEASITRKGTPAEISGRSVGLQNRSERKQTNKQTINQSINRPNKQTNKQSIDQTNKQTVNQSLKQTINKSNKQMRELLRALYTQCLRSTPMHMPTPKMPLVARITSLHAGRSASCQSATRSMRHNQHLTHPHVILQLLFQQHRDAKTAPL
jgi:hypothetical protein